ncbi:MAG: hypothetical protein AAF447_27610 [Myxococcota bacterium]
MTSFDPAGFYAFDLEEGAVRAGGDRVLVMSDTVVTALVSAAEEAGDLSALRVLGMELGARAKGRLPDVAAATPLDALGEAAAPVALFGWGRLRLERWGAALVLELENAPALGEDGFAEAALLGGLLSGMTGREAACVPARHEGARRFVVVSASIADTVYGWALDGFEVGAIVERLTRGAA